MQDHNSKRANHILKSNEVLMFYHPSIKPGSHCLAADLSCLYCLSEGLVNLVANCHPTRSQIVMSAEQLEVGTSRAQLLSNIIDLLWLLRVPSLFTEYDIRSFLESCILWRISNEPYKADLLHVSKVEANTVLWFAILVCLHPYDGIHKTIEGRVSTATLNNTYRYPCSFRNLMPSSVLELITHMKTNP